MDPEFGAVYPQYKYFELPGIFMLPADLRSDNFLNFT